MSKKNIYEPLDMPRRVILGPGPSSANPRVLRAMSLPIVGYLDPAFFDLLEKVSGMLNEIFLTNQMSFAVAGSDTCNQSNEIKRSNLRLEGWTEVYSLLKASSEVTNPRCSPAS